MFSNYQVKTILPKLIIAAILINISWYVCAALIDLSNIAGRGVFELIKSVTPPMDFQGGLSGIVSGTGEILAVNLFGAIVAGGAVLAAFLAGTGGIIIVIAALVSGLVGIFAAWITLLLRNVVVVLCVILSPIAIVAYILPNTKKLFDYWRKTFTTMLVMFPLISLFMAGCGFAAAIMVNMDKTSAIMAIGAFIIQFIPLVALPFMIRKTSGVLSTVQGKIGQYGRKITSEPLRKNAEDLGKKFANSNNVLTRGRFNPIRGLQSVSKWQDRAARGRKMGAETTEAGLAAEYMERQIRVRRDRNGNIIRDQQGRSIPATAQGRAWGRSLASTAQKEIIEQGEEGLNYQRAARLAEANPDNPYYSAQLDKAQQQLVEEQKSVMGGWQIRRADGTWQNANRGDWNRIFNGGEGVDMRPNGDENPEHQFAFSADMATRWQRRAMGEFLLDGSADEVDSTLGTISDMQNRFHNANGSGALENDANALLEKAMRSSNVPLYADGGRVPSLRQGDGRTVVGQPESIYDQAGHAADIVYDASNGGIGRDGNHGLGQRSQRIEKGLIRTTADSMRENFNIETVISQSAGNQALLARRLGVLIGAHNNADQTSANAYGLGAQVDAQGNNTTGWDQIVQSTNRFVDSLETDRDLLAKVRKLAGGEDILRRATEITGRPILP